MGLPSDHAGAVDSLYSASMRRLVLLAWIALALSGCARLAVSTASVPESPGGRSARFERSGFLHLVFGGKDGAELALDQLDLRIVSRAIAADTRMVALGPLLPVLPLPLPWWQAAPPETLYLEVQVVPRVPVSFTPGEVAIVSPDGVPIRASGFLGPVVPESVGTYYDWVSTIPRVYLPPGRSSCFVLAFERGAGTGWAMTLDVAGLRTTDEQPIPVPFFELDRGSKWLLVWGGGGRFCAR